MSAVRSHLAIWATSPRSAWVPPLDFPLRGAVELTHSLEQWFYAFSITPHAAPPAAPANATASPFSAGASRGMKRPAGSLNSDVNEYGVPNFIFGGQGGDRGAKRGKGAAGPPCVARVLPSACEGLRAPTGPTTTLATSARRRVTGSRRVRCTARPLQLTHSWLRQDCPEKAERDAARPPRGSGRPLQRQSFTTALVML